MEKYLNLLPGVVLIDNKEFFLSISVLTEITSPGFKEYVIFYKHESLLDSNASSEIKWFTRHRSIEKASKLIYEVLQKEKFVHEFLFEENFYLKNKLYLN